MPADASYADSDAPLPAAVYDLAINASACRDLPQLIFHMLNRTIGLAHYDRAVLWTGLTTNKPRLLGISGEAKVQESAPLLDDWRSLIAVLSSPSQARVLRQEDFGSDASAAWERLTSAGSNLAICWIPLACAGDLWGGLWLERWQGRVWTTAEIKSLAALGRLYALAWRGISSRPKAAWSWRGYAAVVALLVLMCLPVPLRVTAPCEVVAKNPRVIAAPIDGVIERLAVRSGEEVKEDDLLAAYDRTVLNEELRVSELQVEMLRADVERNRASALSDPRRRPEIGILEARLAQAEIKRQLAEERLRRAEVRAPCAGTAMVDDETAWQGRPVRIGERLLTIVDPADTRLRLWLTSEDDIELATPEIKVRLHAEPGASLLAKVGYVSRVYRLSPDGIPAFAVEAEWLDTCGCRPQVGNRGMAYLYGRRTLLIHFLLRRPLLRLRLWLGI